MTLFDFDKTYAGSVWIETEKIPCSISFENNQIVLSVLMNSIKDAFPAKKSNVKGILATESGVKEFKAISLFQSFRSHNWSSFNRERYILTDLTITHENNNIGNDEYKEISVVFDNLTHLGPLVKVDHDIEKMSINVSQPFEKIVFYEDECETIELNNPVSFNHSNLSYEPFKITVEPFFSVTSSIAFSTDKLYDKTSEIACFFAIVIRQ